MAVIWNNLNKIASHKGRVEPFPHVLPDVTVCDFDELKNSCCVHRAGNLCSVDTVLVGKDGRLYFVEFKDSVKNPIASLKKKAFDSISIFWMTLGQNESIASICGRAVFLYVKPDADCEPQPSTKFAEQMLLRDAGNLAPPKSRNGHVIADWLNDFKVAKLYFDVEVLSASEFVEGFSNRFDYGEDVSFAPCQTSLGTVPDEFVSLKERTSLNGLLKKARLAMGCTGGDFCDDKVEAIDFRGASANLLKNRMYLPEDDFSGNRQDMLYVATALRHKALYTYHNWERVRNPLCSLVNCVFDSAYLAAWIVSPQATFVQAVAHLSAVIAYDGDFDTLTRSPKVKWLQQFYDQYIKWFNGELSSDKCPDVKFGLGCFVEDGLYDKISTTNNLPLVIRED